MILNRPDLSQWSRDDLEAQCAGSRREMRVLHQQLEEIRAIYQKVCKSYHQQWKRFTVADEELAKREKVRVIPPQVRHVVQKAKSLLQTIDEMPQAQRDALIRRLKELEEEEAWEDIKEEEQDETPSIQMEDDEEEDEEV